MLPIWPIGGANEEMNMQRKVAIILLLHECDGVCRLDSEIESALIKDGLAQGWAFKPWRVVKVVVLNDV